MPSKPITRLPVEVDCVVVAVLDEPLLLLLDELLLLLLLPQPATARTTAIASATMIKSLGRIGAER
jgi:hypothetical protein